MIALILHINSSIWRIVSMVLLFAFWGSSAFAQLPDSIPERSADNAPAIMPMEDMPVYELNDTLALADATKKKKELEEGHSARKAVIYALVLPGAGQIYNKKYFKLPFVYGAIGGVGYWINYNFKQYHEIVDIYEKDQSDLNERYLKYWRRNLELSFICMGAAYALQVVDAYVDANLYYWDVTPDLTMRMEPYIQPLNVPGNVPAASYGLRLGFCF